MPSIWPQPHLMTLRDRSHFSAQEPFVGELGCFLAGRKSGLGGVSSPPWQRLF